MALILNVLWLLLGGIAMAASWFVAGLLAAVSIVGIPWARACFNIGLFTLWPFGRTAISRTELTGQEDIGTGPLGLIGNVIWVLVLGVWLAIGHVIMAVLCAITIIGIPFAIQHLKLASMSLFPVGMAIVDEHVAVEARRVNAGLRVARYRS